MLTPDNKPGYDDVFQDQVKHSISSELPDKDVIIHQTIRTLTVDEVTFMCKKLKLGKSNRIQPEHIRYGGCALFTLLTLLYNAITGTENIPQHKHGIIVPIPKGTDKDYSLQDSYRGITLLPVLSKLYETLLLRQSEPWLNTPSMTYKQHHK